MSIPPGYEEVVGPEDQNNIRGGSTSSQTRRRTRPRIFSRSLSHDPSARRSNFRSTSENGASLERRLSETHARERIASDSSSVFTDNPLVSSAPSIVLEQDESLSSSNPHLDTLHGNDGSTGTEPLMMADHTSQQGSSSSGQTEIQIELL